MYRVLFDWYDGWFGILRRKDCQYQHRFVVASVSTVQTVELVASNQFQFRSV